MAQILIATDGTLDDQRTADVVARLYEPGDEVCVMTAIEFPREFLSSVAKVSGVEDVARFAAEAGAGVLGIGGGAKAAERIALSSKETADHPLGDYFAKTAHERTDSLRDVLRERGVDAVAAWASTEHQTARTILGIAETYEADILVIGAKGGGRFEGPLGSTVTKLVRRAPMNVVIIK